MCDFRNKKILLFSVQTFNLEKEIKNKLEQLGALVDYYDERPANNSFTKAIIRLKRKLYQTQINKYYKNILEKTESSHYDYVLVIRGEVVPAFFLQEFKIHHPNCQLIFYTWDSIDNNSHPLQIISHFHRRFTFDPSDALRYDLQLRPLFFLDQFNSIKYQKCTPEYDLLFLGTAHSDRYVIGEFAQNWCCLNGLKSFTFYYMQGRLVYLYKKLFDKTFKTFNYRKLSFKSLSIAQILDYYRKSKVVLDVNHFRQKGLTMRTFEAIGAGKKLITTNKEVIRYPFYHPNNILIIDRDEIRLKPDFFVIPYQEIQAELYDKLTIDGWLTEIFFEEIGKTKWVK